VTAKTAQECFKQISQPGNVGRSWIRTDKRDIRFGELQDRAGRMAALLKQHGAGLGERVVIATRDDGEAALLFASLVINGVTAVNIDADTARERAIALITRSKPRLIIVDRALKERWEIQGLGFDIVEIVSEPAKSGGLLGGLRKKAPTEGLHALLAQVTPVAPPAHVPPETLAYILFTSGTTKQPKGVCISHRALFAHLETLSRIYGYTDKSVILNTLMLSHTDGMTQGPMIGFYNAATVHRPFRFEITTLEALLDSVYQLRITHMVAVPTMLSLMNRLGSHQSDAFQGGDFKVLISCAAALEPALWEAVEQTFRVKIINVYGLTETVTGGVFAGEIVGTHRYGTIGRPIDCELRVVDDNGKDLPDDEAGELLMRGEMLMSGYFDDETETREAMRDGWFHTGDIAKRDAEGLYWICGRKKNIVIRGGYNIHPEEIAEVLNRAPNVREVVAFGVPDPEWGEKLVALVAASNTDEQTLLEFCKGSMEPRKVPSRIVIVDELPKGRSGKVVIDEARAMFEQPAKAKSSGGSDAASRLLDIASQCFRVDRNQIRLSATPQDVVGWDSLAHMEFVVSVESEFGVSFSPREVMGLDRLDKVLALLEAR